MQRFNSWELKLLPDFWRETFKPKDLLRVTAHINSILSMRQDAKILERYDIEEIPEHSIGNTKIWEKVEFGDYEFTSEDDIYPYAYDIDPDWVYIDALYDKHVDPVDPRQVNVDFKLTKGKIYFAKPLSTKTMYISKGRYAGYRIYNEIGNFLEYRRKDSTFYRDSIEPILAAFYLGPSYERLLAVLNLMFGYPVAKYGNETVQTIKDGIVETDKYSYPMGNAHICVTEGQLLKKYQVLTDAVELITHKTHPYWWEDRPVELFAKYRVDGPMSNDLRNYLMRNFLYDAVAYVRFNTQLQDLERFAANQDILKLFLDALPTRTDIFMGQQYRVKDLDTYDEILSPNYDNNGVKLGAASIYGLTNINSAMWIYAPSIGRPIWTDNKNDALALTLDDWRWHIFDNSETDNWKEFWKSSPSHASYVEPHYDCVYARLVSESPWEHHEEHIASLGFPTEVSDQGIKLNLKGDTSGGIYSELPMDITDAELSYTTVQAETVCATTEFTDWTLHDLSIGKDGLQVSNGDQGYAITQGFSIGGIPKNLFIRAEYDTPEDTLIDIKQSFDKVTWEDVPEIATSVTGTVYYKIILYASVRKSPTFRRLYVNINYVE